MNWQQLKIQIIPEHVDFIEPQLLAAGAVSITYLDAEDQPVFQEELDSTPLWDSLVLCALFEEDTELGELLSWLGGNASIVNRASLEVEKIEDQAWERSWIDNFSAMRFGQDLQGKDTVDYGCGSGILAIAAALLGAQSVQGVDNDPQAVLATNDNCERNGLLPGRVGTFLPEEYDSMSTPESVDILLANILAAPLLSLASKFASLVKPKGSIVLSGLLAEQADAITEVYSEWFEMSAAVQREDWIRLSGIKR